MRPRVRCFPPLPEFLLDDDPFANLTGGTVVGFGGGAKQGEWESGLGDVKAPCSAFVNDDHEHEHEHDEGLVAGLTAASGSNTTLIVVLPPPTTGPSANSTVPARDPVSPTAATIKSRCTPTSPSPGYLRNPVKPAFNIRQKVGTYCRICVLKPSYAAQLPSLTMLSMLHLDRTFHDTIKAKACIGQVTGDLYLSLQEVLALTPEDGGVPILRGKYDYKVFYQSIARLFLLPKDDQHVLFIHAHPTGSDLVLTSGDAVYARRGDIVEADIAKYDNLKKNYERSTYELVTSVLRALAGNKIIKFPKVCPPLIKCGRFLLECYIFFVSKQPTLIEINDIHQVIFSRVGAGVGASTGRTFVLKIVIKSSPQHNFTSINVISSDSGRGKSGQKKVSRKDDDDSSKEDGDLIMGDSDSDSSGAKTASDANASSGDKVKKPTKKKAAVSAAGCDVDEDDGKAKITARRSPRIKRRMASDDDAMEPKQTSLSQDRNPS
ncbi:hypothetical protein BYT27DRAFT_7253109 [Phlegmacium glaucopus]|nr:hypothetical protein BYT27DRAFT_7253109 [Phlegmacium glaucopus]